MGKIELIAKTANQTHFGCFCHLIPFQTPVNVYQIVHASHVRVRGIVSAIFNRFSFSYLFEYLSYVLLFCLELSKCIDSFRSFFSLSRINTNSTRDQCAFCIYMLFSFSLIIFLFNFTATDNILLKSF